MIEKQDVVAPPKQSEGGPVHRGSSMKSKQVAMFLADLGVTKTHSRPHVSDDNPYSESHFKTLKYRPNFPARFGSIQDARGFSGDFFRWYNDEHHHTGLGLLTPGDVHFGLAEQRHANRAVVLKAAQRPFVVFVNEGNTNVEQAVAFYGLR